MSAYVWKSEALDGLQRNIPVAGEVTGAGSKVDANWDTPVRHVSFLPHTVASIHLTVHRHTQPVGGTAASGRRCLTPSCVRMNSMSTTVCVCMCRRLIESAPGKPRI